MAVYHFTWDLEFFGYLPAGLTAHGGWKLFARAIASSFLFLVGVSVVLGHGRGVRWRSFGRRFASVAGAALLITIVTYLTVREEFIFFGILHQIALASLLGLLFIQLPPLLTALVAAGVIAAPFFLRHAVFDHPALWWVGLSVTNPRSNDYVPFFPWFGAVLLGIAATRAAGWRNGFTAPGHLPSFLRFPALAGRHSLLFYLVHQPVLIGLVWLFAQVFPAEPETREVRFMRSCEASCVSVRDQDFCSRYCACMLDGIEQRGMMDDVFKGGEDAALQSRVAEVAGICTGEADSFSGSPGG